MQPRNTSAPPASRKRPDAAARAGLGVAFATVLLLLTEITLRIGGVGPAYEADKIGGWTMIPHVTDMVVESFEGGTFRVSTNEEGMRTAIPREKTPGVTRVAVMGDSTVFGWGVDDGGTIADGLQQGLADFAGEIGPVEVLNAGQPGYSTTQVTDFFEGVVSAWKPDYLVVFLPHHDHNYVAVSDREHLDGGRGLASLRVVLAKYSRIYQLLRQQLSPLSGNAYVLPNEEHDDLRVPRVSDEERTENLDRIAEMMAEWGGRVSVGFLPSYVDLTHDRAAGRIGDTWAVAYAAEKGTAFIDLRPCCGPNGAHLALPHDKGHLNRDGNLQAGRWGARQLADWIRSTRAK